MEKQFDLGRFLNAHETSYQTALSEIQNGYKVSHWMWYIFPQLKGLGWSSTSDYYGIDGFEEARAYLSNETLNAHLVEISKVLLELPTCNATEVFGSPDDMKLKSCMTLFNFTEPDNEVFKAVLDKFWNGQTDRRTLSLLDV